MSTQLIDKINAILNMKYRSHSYLMINESDFEDLPKSFVAQTLAQLIMNRKLDGKILGDNNTIKNGISLSDIMIKV